jgi:GNAT superfamily N-acetyltransferase
MALPTESHPTSKGTLGIRPAVPADVPVVLGFIRELAEYEKALPHVAATEERLGESLFGNPRRAEAILGELGEQAVACAVFYPSFSTYLGRACLHLEDLYVRPESRGAGVGKSMLSYLARVTRARQCARLEWSSLAWNEPAKRFYLRLGAMAEERRMFHLSGAALEGLAIIKE